MPANIHTELRRSPERISLLMLPLELLLALFKKLDQRSLARLCCVCKSLNTIIIETGWKDYCRTNHRITESISTRWFHLNWPQRAKETYQINLGWSSRQFVSKPLNSRWRKFFHPHLALSSSRLVVAAGPLITSYKFAYDRGRDTSKVILEGTYSVSPGSTLLAVPSLDITGIAFLPDEGKDETLLVSNASGAVFRVQIPCKTHTYRPFTRTRGRYAPESPTSATRTASYDIHVPIIRALTTKGNFAVVLTASGAAGIFNAASPWIAPVVIDIGKPTWSGHLEAGSSTPYIAIGTAENVSIHSFSDGLIRKSPSAILGGPGRATPVYCVGQYIPGGPPDIIASGWYDGKVRVHDLRVSQRMWKDELGANEGTALAPVMTLSDPWRAFDPIYSIAARAPMSDENERETGRGSGLPHHQHYLIAGSALHSVVCLWDVRNPSGSWSLFAPGADRSPVYSLKAEGSRIWGATQWRAFIVDFAPDAERTVYPFVSEREAYSVADPYSHGYGFTFPPLPC